MHLSARIVRLELEEPFTIARGTETEVEVVQVEIAHDGMVGMGEATPIERYDEYPSSALAYLEAHADELGDDPFALDAILERIPREQFAARLPSTPPCTTCAASSPASRCGASSACCGRGRLRP